MKGKIVGLVIGLPIFVSCTALNDTKPPAETAEVAAVALPNAETESVAKPLWSIDPNCVFDPDSHAELGSIQHLDVWHHLRANFALEYHDHPRIENHLNWYAKNKLYMARVSERARPYLYEIVRKLEARDMPLELALLPIVESAFDPFAYSHGRASGMWQFIPGTGRHYGLKQNWWYDGRRDIEASTDAALDYLSDLHKNLDGDWLLALAAYNTGEGNVRKAIRRNQRAGKPTDFWSLRLPRETRAYVPQLLALSKIVGDPQFFDVTLTPIPNEPYYKVVAIDSQIDLAKAAELAEMDLDELYMLNPGFNRWATDPSGPHRLLIPLDNSDVFNTNLSNYPAEQRVAWENYRVKKGDSLLLIAKHFNTTVDTLRDVNNIRGNIIRVGDELLIPTAGADPELYGYSAEQRLERIQASSQGKQGTQKINYRVKSGDSFWKIAQLYKVSVRQLAKWNGMAPRDTLQVGQKLVIWAQPERITTVVQNKRQGNELIRKVNYRVRNGDSLSRIASKFNLSVNDIVQWNAIQAQKYIQPGQRLTLFVDITEN